MKKITFLLLLIPIFSFSQTTYVPDDNFEAYLEANSMGNGIANDNYVTTANISGVTNLNVSSQNITNLIGVGDFTALTELICAYNQLTSLDISTNTTLTTLWCQNNQLPSLDVSTNTALTELICSSNQLTSLDVSTNTTLTALWCQNNQLPSLDVSTNTALTQLLCNSNQLTSLDVSTNTALTTLGCRWNQLTSLDVSTNTALTQLICYSNQLTSLDVRNGNNTAISSGNFNATANPSLTCILVDDASWSATNWTNIDAASTFVNNETECTALSIQDNTFGSEFNVYPNPSFGSSKIELGENYNEVSVNVFNVLGKQVATQTHYNTNVIELNTQELATGIYFIKVQSGVKEATIKLVVN